MKVSIAIPYHTTDKTAFYLSRLLKSIEEQTFKDYEIILTKEGDFAENHNAAIKKSTGDIIKLMQMDDYFTHQNALRFLVHAFDNDESAKWLISATKHTDGVIHQPRWTEDIYTGNNQLGSVSSISVRRGAVLLFEEPLQWVVDCDWYYRMKLKYGFPMLLLDPGVTIDIRTDRLSHTIPTPIKLQEIEYLQKKYAK